MRSNHLVLSVLFVCATLSSCQEFGPQPPSMVGQFVVSAKLSNGKQKEIKESVKDAQQEAKEDIQKAREEVEAELGKILTDTSTVEGKIAYFAKKLGSTMASAGLDLGEQVTDWNSLGEGLGKLLFKDLELDIELLDNGDIKANSAFIQLGLHNAKWEVKGDELLFTKEGDDTPDVFKIDSRSSDGFTLLKDNIELTFVKKKVEK
ncbi:MAG: hypothetical protein WAU01_13150 [Saprospiraceae bacterium]